MTKKTGRIASVLATLALLLTLAPAVPAADAGAVDINTATEEQLVALPGIGPAKAKAIVDYRKAHPFQTVEELQNVRGIGDKLFESIKAKIEVGSASVPAAGAARR